jgi:hypothetical protein
MKSKLHRSLGVAGSWAQGLATRWGEVGSDEVREIPLTVIRMNAFVLLDLLINQDLFRYDLPDSGSFRTL